MKKGLCILMAVGLMMGMITPCSAAEIPGDVTAESLIDGYLQKNEDASSVSGVEKLALSMKMAMLGEEMSMKMDMLLDIESTKEISHVYGDMYMSEESTSEEENTEESVVTEMYSVKEEDGSYTVYSLDSEDGTWTVSTLDEEMFNMDMRDLIKGEGFELSEETVDLDGVTCYEVKGAMALADMMEYMGNSVEGLSEILPVGEEEDAEEYNLEVLYYFNVENNDLFAMKMDGAAMLEKLFMDALVKSFGEIDTAEDESFDMSQLLALFQIEIPEFVVEVSDFEFDTVESIEIPAEALEAGGDYLEEAG